MLRHLCVSLVILSQVHTGLTLAQAQFTPNPLEVTTPDPLLPPLRDKQQLTIPERQNLERALDALNQEATAKLQGGDQPGAFAIWNRETRLRRYLGAFAEVKALSRFGAIAWSENAGQQVRYITQRLQTIQQQAQKAKDFDLELMVAIGEAYQKVRSPKLALEAYEQVLTVVEQQQDIAAVLQTLRTIGELHLSWFDYPQAAATYEQLLKLTATPGDRASELVYLQQLSYIYQQNQQPQAAIDTLQRIVTIYQQENKLTKIPELQLAIGVNYQSLAQKNPSLLKQAFNNYQQAYIIAMESRQYVRAGEALQKIISLYIDQGQTDAALEVSQILLETQEQAMNYYGMMAAYDQIGQLYLQTQNYSQALAAFKKGLELAQQLKHQETYFTQQIEKASK
jgi:tetratricopeptide (TPR) repeat protein